MLHYKQAITFSGESTEIKSNAVSIVCPSWLSILCL